MLISNRWYVSYFILIFNALFIAACGDSSDSPTATRQTVTANAGSTQELLENTVVTLNASNSQGSAGQTINYQWQQVYQQGVPILSIQDPNSATAKVTIPILKDDTDFALRLTVTDDQGSSSTDDLLLKVRKAPAIIFGNISGNTATVGAKASFSVSLASKPTSDVVLNITSSDLAQGTVDASPLTFTPANFSSPQNISITGQNPNVLGGTQNYQINFTTASQDPLYDQLTVAPVDIEGIVLKIQNLAIINNFIPDTVGSAQPIVSYTGNNSLTYSLTQAPNGMSISATTGIISWTPTNADAGNDVTITVQVTDQTLTQTKDFVISVIAPRPVILVSTPSTVLVNDPSSNLNGMKIVTGSITRSLPAANQVRALDSAKLTIMPSNAAPANTLGMTKLSDVFYANASINNEQLKVEFDINTLPAGVTAEDIHLYIYTQAQGINRPFWSPLSLATRTSMTAEGAHHFEVDIAQMEGLFVWGHHQTSPAISNESLQSSRQNRVDLPKIATCEQKPVDSGNYLCRTALLQDFVLYIDNFGQGSRWGATDVETLASWIFAVEAFIKQVSQLTISSSIIVTIEPMPIGKKAYVITDKAENYKVIHLSDNNAIMAADMQVAIANALAQQFVYQQSKSLSLDADWTDPRFAWAVAGFSAWLEDVVLDEVDSYRARITPIPRILEKGVLLSNLNGENAFAILKMVQTHCPALLLSIDQKIQQLLTVIQTGDIDDIENTITQLMVNSLCDFGTALGTDPADKSSYKLAALFYQVATLMRGDMSILDLNETQDEGDFQPTPYQFTQGAAQWLSSVDDWLNRDDTSVPYQLKGIETIPPLGAYSFWIPAVEGTIPSGNTASFSVEKGEVSALWVAISSDDSNFTATGQIANTPTNLNKTLIQKYTYTYPGNTVPMVFVTLFNPSKFTPVVIREITFNIE